MAAGSYHTLLLDENGIVWSFGNGYYGQLGHGDTKNQLLPKQIAGIPKIIAVATGFYKTLLLDINGIAWSCGYGENGALGHADKANKVVPTKIEGIPLIAIPKKRFKNTKNARNWDDER